MGGIEPPWQTPFLYALRVQLFYGTHEDTQNSKDTLMRAVKCNSSIPITAVGMPYPSKVYTEHISDGGYKSMALEFTPGLSQMKG